MQPVDDRIRPFYVPGSDEPRYTEQQVQRILKRAGERERADSARRDSGDLSQEDVVRIGLELGISEGGIRQALREETSGSEEHALSAFHPMAVIDYALPDLPVETHNEVVEMLRTEFGESGRSAKIDETLEWSGGEGLSNILVSLTPTKSGSRLRFRSDQRALAILFGFLCTMASLVSLGVLGDSFAKWGWGFVLLMAGVASLLFFVWFTATSTAVKKRKRAIRRAASKVQALAAPAESPEIQSTVLSETEEELRSHLGEGG